MSKKQEYKLRNERFLAEKRETEGIHELRGGVLYEVIASDDHNDENTPNVKPGARSVVTCHYKGATIPKEGSGNIYGKVFDDTFTSGCPAAFRVNELISGFQIALVNMHVGDYWRVYIPSEMGYGSRGAGSDIPGNSTLIFEIQLIAVG